MDKRVSIRLDPEIISIIERNKDGNEQPVKCLKRLIKIGDENSSQIEEIRREYQRSNAEILQIVKTSIAEQRATIDRFIQAITNSFNPKKIENIPDKIDQRVYDFTESIKQPFHEISENLNHIRESIENLTEE